MDIAAATGVRVDTRSRPSYDDLERPDELGLIAAEPMAWRSDMRIRENRPTNAPGAT
jgi:hypothetical protein